MSNIKETVKSSLNPWLLPFLVPVGLWLITRNMPENTSSTMIAAWSMVGITMLVGFLSIIFSRSDGEDKPVITLPIQAKPGDTYTFTAKSPLQIEVPEPELWDIGRGPGATDVQAPL